MRRLGVDPTPADGLAAFRRDRSTVRGPRDAGGVRVVDDYAHHPTEVAALLRGRALGRRRRPRHRRCSSRTCTRAPATFAAEFGAAFDLADVVVVTDVYAAREDPDPAVTGALIVDRVPTPGKATFVADRLEAAARASPPRRGPATCCSRSAPGT